MTGYIQLAVDLSSGLSLKLHVPGIHKTVRVVKLRLLCTSHGQLEAYLHVHVHL